MVDQTDKTTVKVDKALVKRAHDVGLNVSKVCENALGEAIRRLKGPSEETKHATNGGTSDSSPHSKSGAAGGIRTRVTGLEGLSLRPGWTTAARVNI